MDLNEQPRWIYLELDKFCEKLSMELHQKVFNDNLQTMQNTAISAVTQTRKIIENVINWFRKKKMDTPVDVAMYLLILVRSQALAAIQI